MSTPTTFYVGTVIQPDWLNTVVTTFNNISDMTNAPFPAHQDVVYLKGYRSANDGGEGHFVWDATNTLADNAGTIIKPTSILSGGAGRWVRLYSGLPNPLMFGAYAEDSDDSTDAFVACLNWSDNIEVLAGTYRVRPSTLFSRGDIIGRDGVTIRNPGTTNGYGIYIENGTCTISNIRIIGYQVGISGTDGTTDWTIDSVEFASTLLNSVFITGFNIQRLTIKNCKVLSGINTTFASLNQCNNFRLESNTALCRVGVNITGCVEGIISGNRFNGIDQQIIIQNSSSFIRVNSNFLGSSNTTGSCVVLLGSVANIIVSGNEIIKTGTTQAFYVNTGTTGLIFTNNITNSINIPGSILPLVNANNLVG